MIVLANPGHTQKESRFLAQDGARSRSRVGQHALRPPRTSALTLTPEEEVSTTLLLAYDVRCRVGSK
ncbi:protein of unknown function [Methanoculleus bourgensis]|uniref:Uncharacterized protein n=1 Tax=Methanoculleus bourgensis TaxID=83986 RepID=A0A0X3BP18_9EURY|nr:protein of unknown function [Methanoculleus bourgensis]